MKTILIVVAGMADLPDPISLRETPLVVAGTPSLDMLGRRGEVATIYSISDKHPISHKNALLSLLGYDLERGEPSTEELMKFGLDHSTPLTAYSSLKPFIIPGFSGHGVCITSSAWVRGISKCGFINPLDIYSPGSSDAEILETIAGLTTGAIITNEFVLVYVDNPLKASLRGDYEAKINSLSVIDRHLITPIADFVWHSELMINLAVTTDLVTPWHRKRPALMSVPAIFYFNNNDYDGDPERKFTEVEAMLMNRNLHSPSDLIRYLISFSTEEE